MLATLRSSWGAIQAQVAEVDIGLNEALVVLVVVAAVVLLVGAFRR